MWDNTVAFPSTLCISRNAGMVRLLPLNATGCMLYREAILLAVDGPHSLHTSVRNKAHTNLLLYKYSMQSKLENIFSTGNQIIHPSCEVLISVGSLAFSHYAKFMHLYRLTKCSSPAKRDINMGL